MQKRIGMVALMASMAGALGVGVGATQEGDLVALQKDPGQWVMPNGNYAAWNYSPLDQINLDTVRDLSVAWTLPLPITDSYEASPIVVGDMMYVVTPKPNYVYAINLARGGIIEWEFRAELEELSLTTQRACCGGKTRGLAFGDGKIFFNALDGQVIALDARTGRKVWSDGPTNYAISEVRTGPPIVAGRHVIVGVAGGDRGVRGHVTAYDIDTGKRAWRVYNIGPNEDVGIGPRFRPFYADDKVPNPALASWHGESWRLGGASVWGWFSYDPELNYLYYGTGNCGPWNPDYRREWGVVDLDEHGGVRTFRNNYCASILARDAATGELIWAYNVTPQDQWDLDEMSAAVLVDLAIDGRTRRALIKASRNGYFYVLDRATGELLVEPWAFGPNDIMRGVDMTTGRPLYNIEKMNFTHLDDRKRYVPNATDTAIAWCPGVAARNWQNDAFSPRTGLLYTSTSNRCGTMRVVEGTFVPGGLYNLRTTPGAPPRSPMGDHAGELQANDPVSRKTVWRVKWPTGNNTPVMATGGDLVFQGGADQGLFRAFNARTGDIVWTFRTGSNFQNSAISYLGPDRRQYIAIIGSSAGGDPQVAYNAGPDAVARHRRAGSVLYVFALPPSVTGRSR
jgi:PQQ-dependent dehydrogenase (methanol/ethanol family)